MRTFSSSAAGLLLITLCAELAAQTPRPANPLLDSLRLFKSSWDAQTLVRPDSTATDSLAVKRILTVDWLGPNRFVYTGRLARSGKMAMLGWVNGTTRLLMVGGRKVIVPPKDRFTVELADPTVRTSPYYDPPVFARIAVGRRLLYVEVPFRRESSQPLYSGGSLKSVDTHYEVYATDGVSWQAIKPPATINTRLGPRDVGTIDDVAYCGGDTVLLTFRANIKKWFSGVLRLADGRFDSMIVLDDTLAGGTGLTSKDFSAWSVSRESRFWLSVLGPSNKWRWMQGPQRYCSIRAVMNRKMGKGFLNQYVGKNYVLLAPDTLGNWSMILKSSDTVPGHPSREIGDYAAYRLRDGSFLISPGGRVVMVGKPNAWHLPLDRPDAQAVDVANEFGDVVSIGDGSGLIAALHKPSTASWLGTVPDLYYFDQNIFERVAWQGALPLTPNELKALSTKENYANFFLNGMPGYADAAFVHLRLPSLYSGANFQSLFGMLFDPIQRRLVPIPALAVAGRPAVGLDQILGWNNDDEAVAWDGYGQSEIILLRRTGAHATLDK